MPSSCTKESRKRCKSFLRYLSQNYSSDNSTEGNQNLKRRLFGRDDDHNELIKYEAAQKAVELDNHEELVQILRTWSQPKKSSLGHLLLSACELNADVSITKTIIDYGANVNFASTKDQLASCMMMATRNNNLVLVELLISSGAKVNATDKFGWTALFYASYLGQSECARRLLECGANVNTRDSDEMSCLIWASGRGQLSLVELLLSHGANVNSVDRYNSSSLLWASRKGESQVAASLLHNGADINQQGMYGWSPLIAAVKGNHRDTVNLLLNHRADFSLRDGAHMNALMIACAEFHEEVAMDLIQHLRADRLNLDQVNGHGQTALILAAKAKCPKLVVALLEAGACTKQLDQEGRSALDWSQSVGDAESCRALEQVSASSIRSAIQ